jgi:hypothetical protein
VVVASCRCQSWSDPMLALHGVAVVVDDHVGLAKSLLSPTLST